MDEELLVDPRMVARNAQIATALRELDLDLPLADALEAQAKTLERAAKAGSTDF
jgi:hypothetical protein